MRPWLAVICALVLAVPARATDLLTRVLTAHDGLPGLWTTSLAVDARGHLWAAGPSGLIRYDGAEVETLTAPGLGHHPSRIVTAPDGQVVVREELGPVFSVVDGVLGPVEGPSGAALEADDVLLRADGTLLVLIDGALWGRTPAGAWTLRLEADDDRALVDVFEGPAGALLLAGRSAWWTWRPGQAPRELTDARRGNRHAEVDADGVTWLMDGSPARLRRLVGDAATEVWRDDAPGPHRGFAVLDGTAWLGDDGVVFAVHADGRAERFGRAGAPLVARGPWLADAEGSVWSGGYEGIVQIPAPDLRIHGSRDGLASNATRGLLVRERDVLVAGWRGIDRVVPDTGEVSPASSALSKGYLCADARGVAWARAETSAGADVYVAIGIDGEVATHPAPSGTFHLYGCAAAADGGVWFVDRGRLALTGPADEPPRDLGLVPVPPRGIHQVLEDRGGRLWASSRLTVCNAIVDDVLAGAAPWSCEEVPARYQVDDLFETEAGAIWAVERTGGVYARGPDGFSAVPGVRQLASLNLRKLVASPRGGQWVLGAATAARVVERPDHPDGWEIVERLPRWLGPALSSVVDLVELPDGTVWMASHVGVVQVPARARDLPRPPPDVLLNEVRVDGEIVDPAQVVVPPEGRLTVRWAAASLKAPTHVRYRSRVDDGPWSAPTALPGLELAGLSPGRHALAVAATSDLQAWSARPLVLDVVVPLPWWQRPWVWVLAIVAAAGLLVVAVQLRAAVQLREARLRNRVAMDLHDEVGAGLASIGLLAGLARDSAVPPDDLRRLAGRIADDAQDLGASVSGMVWSLREGAGSAPALAAFLESRARALLPDLDVAGDLHVEEDPALEHLASLDLDVLRAVQLAALEALHNVARHAAATEAWLGVGVEGRRLVVRVADDGRGFDPDAIVTAPDHGLGLQSMRERLREVGGTCDIRPRADGGTEVVLRVAPRRR